LNSSSPAIPTDSPSSPVQQAAATATPGEKRLALNRWLQIFLTIIAGAVVAVIAWTVVERFLHIIILLLAGFLMAFLLGPVVDRLERTRMPRIVAILLVYLVIIGTVAAAIVLLIGPLTAQLQDLNETLPALVGTNGGAPSGIDIFFKEHGIPLDVAGLQSRLGEYVSGAGTSLLGGTLGIVAGLVSFVTDVFLILAITFYLLLDGRSMHSRALRLLPASAREKWFFVEAALNRVLGGYIRGQILVALTVGIAAGAGSALLGVHYALVIGLLAFLFEFIPLVGPVLGMVPAVLIALFQSPGLALWVVIYFIILQQVESNVIVPRVSGHAVGLHPLGVLLALLAGVELGGLGGALLAVPVAGVLYVMALALYSDATRQTEMLVAQPHRTTYTGTALRSMRRVIDRRIKGSTSALRTAPAKGGATMPVLSSAVTGNGTAYPVGAEASSDVTPAVATTAVGGGPDGSIDMPGAAPNERLATIAQDQSELVERFAAAEAEEASEAAAQSARAASK
jgi:predicted PurR-regulated permease PerM